jgi:hypothetical protein
MPRMVIQEHTRDSSAHYDLMMESPTLLWTWRFQDFPGSEPEQPCERIQDHDRKFLEYEGELSPGNGSVRIVAGGTFDLLSAREDEVDFTARAQTVAGSCRLVKRDETHWILRCQR